MKTIRKKNLKLVLLLSLFNFLILNLTAAKSIKMQDVRITIIFNDTLTRDIKIAVTRSNLNGSLGSEELIFKKVNSSQYAVNIPSLIEASRVSIYSSDSQLNLIFYYIEPGDNITISMSGTTPMKKLIFKGKGSGSFRYKYILDSINKADSKLHKFKAYDLSQLKQSMNLSDSSATKYLEIIDRNRELMSRKIYLLHRADILGSFTNGKWFYIDAILRKTNNREELYPLIRSFLKLNLINSNDTEISSLSETYVSAKIRLVKLHLTLENENSTEKIYDYIKSNFTGKLREKLILHYLLGKPRISPELFSKNVNDAVTLLKESKDIIWLKDLLKTALRGTVAFHFKLTDSAGKIFRLADFKGKTIVLDFWFTGCVPCLELAETLDHHVIPKFSDKEVVFISVNLDSKKDRWLESLRQGKYTSPKAINLYTDDLAFSHPISKFYNIKGCPTIIVIDKSGYNFDTNVRNDRPSIISVIESAISTK